LLKGANTLLLAVLSLVFVSATTLVNPGEIGFNGQTRSQNYDTLMDALFSNNKAVTTIGDKMWVPWYSTSSSCEVADLHKGNSCNGGTIDHNRNCMVTDEFSQVGILVAMGKDQARMEQFYNTVLAIKSRNGVIPAWRVFRDGNKIEPCKDGINGNCDTASDATARIISALFTAATNNEFGSAQRTKYMSLAKQMSADFVNYEVVKSCKPSNLGYGNICYWLAAGSEAKRGGMGSTDFGYTGYYADAITAMLQACANTGDQTYCRVARDFTLNYLQAAEFDGNKFSVPPGRSFRWVNLDGVPKAQCTHSCSPVKWDYADAPRALGMCQANYYAKQMGYQLPGLNKYCSLWGNLYMNDPGSAPIEYYPDGKNSGAYQSGYYAQGLQSLFQAGGHNSNLFKPTLDNALKHFTPATKSFDSQSCFGVYMQAFAVRALGMGIGRDLASFKVNARDSEVPDMGIIPSDPDQPLPSEPDFRFDTPVEPTPVEPTPAESRISKLDVTCSASVDCKKKSDVTNGVCRTVVYDTSRGDISLFACEKDTQHAELYTRSAPTGITYNVCLGAGCVSNGMGFARFKLSDEAVTPPAVEQPAEPAVPAESEVPRDAPAADSAIAKLGTTCSAEGCTKRTDFSEGVCRTIVYDTGKGEINLFACEKSGGYAELYTRSAPSGLTYTACLGSGCVSNHMGFARFELSSDKPMTAKPKEQPKEQPVNQPEELDVSKLKFTVTHSGTLVGDFMEGHSCRTVQYSTEFGRVDAKVCEKGDKFEMYLLTKPNAASVCVKTSCVGSSSGFASIN
jgi:hypothetical protein